MARVGIMLGFFAASLLLASSTSPIRHWVYTSTYDRMREQTTSIAGIEALNQATAIWPRKGIVRATLLVLRGPKSKTVELIVENSAVDCSDCKILVKLDTAAAIYWRADAKPSGDGTLLVLDAPVELEHGTREFDAAAAIADAHTIQIEVPLYRRGAYQYRFETSQVLIWPKE